MSGFTTSTFVRHLRDATLFLSAFLGLGLQDAMACSCSAATFAKTYELSANVFTAVITRQYLEQADDNTTVARSTFTITETFKGAQPFDAVVTYPAGPCGIWLEAGVEYLLFTPDSGQIGVCSSTRRTEDAKPQIAALESFVSGERYTLEEPWQFQASKDGCALATTFETGAGGGLGLLTLYGRRARAPEVPTFDSAELRVTVGTDEDTDQLSLTTVDGTTYQATRTAPRFLGTYVIGGDGAVEILRKSMSSDALYLRAGDRGSDLATEVSTVNLAQAGTGAKMLECMSSPPIATPNPQPLPTKSKSVVLSLSTGSPYVPGLHQLVVGDRLDAVKKVFPSAVFDALEAGWVVRLDHPVFRAILYSSRRWPTTFDDDRDTIKRVVYLFRDDEDVDDVAAQVHTDAIEKWPHDQRETTPSGYRTIWRNFDGQIVIVDRQRLLICMEFDWPPPPR